MGLRRGKVLPYHQIVHPHPKQVLESPGVSVSSTIRSIIPRAAAIFSEDFGTTRFGFRILSGRTF